MSEQIQRIECDELWRKLESGEQFVLVDALAPMFYASTHLPGAVNIPSGSVDELAARRIPDPSTEVVVYCSGEACQSSVLVARRLRELGYANVLHYAQGKEGWRAAGYPLEGGRAV